jgi:cell division protein FtsZ
VRPAVIREAMPAASIAPAPAPVPNYAQAVAAAAQVSSVEAIEAALALPEAAMEPEPVRSVTTPHDPRVSIEPYEPAMNHYEAPAPAPQPQQMRVAEPALAQQPYVPPVAERPSAAVQRSRVPSIEEFPPIAQRQAAASVQVHPEDHDGERRPLGLLRRLATVGLGRREDEVQAEAPRAPAPQPAVRPSAASEFVKRPAAAPAQGAAGRLDQQGRMAPQPAPRAADDDMEIPAFLRRK